MKNLIKTSLFVIAISLLSISCNNNRDNDNVITGISKIKVDSVKIPQNTMDAFSVQTIKTYSTYASGCNGFYDYDYVPDALNRYVTAYQYTSNGACSQVVHTNASQFNFRPVEKGTYTFKFWNGKDTSNNDVWIEKTVVVQ